MATYGIPHHHVDEEAKDVPPMVERLRLELNRTVRRHVAEAVDAVCVSFEDDLIELTSAAALSQVVGVESFAVFRDCCSRLAHFIERNMNTTPGFLEQMDRIILACHSGTSGPELLSVVTEDLYICRGDKRVGRKGRKEPVGVNTMLGDFEQPAISPGNAAIPRNGEESSDEKTTTGMTRKLRKRKKVTTSGRSKSIRLLTKRQKRSLITEWRRCSDESEEEKKAEESGDEERAKSPNGMSLMEKRAAELTSRRVKCIYRMVKELGSTEENEQDTVVKAGKNLRGGTAAEAVQCGDGRSTRWNLRSKGKTTKRPSGTITEEGSPVVMRLRYKSRAQMRKGLPRRKTTDTTVTTTEIDVVEEDDELAYVKAAASASMPERNHGPTTPATLEQHARETEQHLDAEEARHDLPLDRENGEMRGACDATDSGDGSEANAEDKEVGDEFEENVAMLDADTTDQEVVSASVSEEPETSDGASPVHNDEKADDDMEMAHCRDASGNSPYASQAPENENDRNLPARTDIQTVEESSTAPVQNEGEEDAIVEDIDEDEPSESLKHDHESSVPGLCDAGMRPPQQVSHFKKCLRRSIQFVDAVLCKPPPGKTCTRNCVKVRERQCSGTAGPGTGIRCQDRLCRNWHETEAHTERCKNPLCEFGNRILLREMRHQIANQHLKTQLLLLEWEEKAMEQIAATTNGTGEQYTPVQLTQLGDDIEKLERSIAEAKEETESLKTSKRVLLANLSAIGVKPQDDVRDGFPDFETHYK